MFNYVRGELLHFIPPYTNGSYEICKSEISFTKISSNTAVIQYIVDLNT